MTLLNFLPPVPPPPPLKRLDIRLVYCRFRRERLDGLFQVILTGNGNERYSGDPKSNHSKTEIIRKPDILKVKFRIVPTIWKPEKMADLV